MAAVKLTLSIPRAVLAGAKAFARRTRQPLSQLTSRYYHILARSMPRQRGKPILTPRVRQATGLGKSHRSADDLLLEALQEKYK